MKQRSSSNVCKSETFRFVVLTDTHINASETKTVSPWGINRHSNARARAAVAAINNLAPDFAVHLGDVVQPLPGHAGYAESSQKAESILSELKCPIKIIPGNHDVGDKPLRWNPARPISKATVDIFRGSYGGDRWSFEHAGCMFVGIDAQLINSGLELEMEQWSWIETTLEEASGKRVFFFLHYPPYICTPNEHEHYDNLGEPGRSRLLGLFERFGTEACFSGHVHNFFYNLYAETRSYTLPALSFVRHDYSGLFPVPPSDDSFGRDDGAKLGFFIVDVDPEGHQIKFLRSYCQAQREGEAFKEDIAIGAGQASLTMPKPFREPFGSSRPVSSGFGATLRTSWAHVTEIAPSGAVDEFRRKPARDDFLIAAIWETGISRLRIPLDDLVDPGRRERICLLASDGYFFQIYCFGMPDAAALGALTATQDSISSIEIILPIDDLVAEISSIEKLGKNLACETVASPLIPSGNNPGTGSFIHFIAHGFSHDDSIPDSLLQSGIDGFSFRIGQEMDPLDHAPLCMAQVNAVGKRAHIHIVTGDSNPAHMDLNVVKTSNRALLAFVASRCSSDKAAIWLDSLSDVDRGYFPRLGLVDRRSNPSASSIAIDTLASQLSEKLPWRVEHRQKNDLGEIVLLKAGEEEVTVFLSDAEPEIVQERRQI